MERWNCPSCGAGYGDNTNSDIERQALQYVMHRQITHGEAYTGGLPLKMIAEERKRIESL